MVDQFSRGVEPSSIPSSRSWIKWVVISCVLFGACVLMSVGAVYYFRSKVMRAYYIPSAAMEPTLLTNDQILVNMMVYASSEPKCGDVIVFKAPPEASPEEKEFVKRIIGAAGDVVRITPGYVMIDDAKYGHSELRDLLGLDPENGKVLLTNGNIYADGKLVKPTELAKLVGLPKAAVTVVPGHVYVNGKILKEDYVAEDSDAAYPCATTVDQKCIVVDKSGKSAIKIPSGKLLVVGDNRNFSNDARFWGLLDRSRVIGKVESIFLPQDRAGSVK